MNSQIRFQLLVQKTINDPIFQQPIKIKTDDKRNFMQLHIWRWLPRNHAYNICSN